MTTLTIRQLSRELYRALQDRAAQNGRSMEDDVRTILEAAINPHARVKLGSLLAEVGRQAKLSDDEFAVFEQVRATAPSRTVITD